MMKMMKMTKMTKAGDCCQVGEPKHRGEGVSLEKNTNKPAPHTYLRKASAALRLLPPSGTTVRRWNGLAEDDDGGGLSLRAHNLDQLPGAP